MTVSLGASMFRGTYSMDYSGMIAAAVLIILPQLVFYAFFQRFIIEGMTAGAVKG
jgi:raffinose/stachyose/melibiose transport system permease protein